MDARKINKAVIPVAGLGTRFLPITKSIPKEMLPIVDKPVVQYIVEEALNAGIKQIILVNGPNKSTIKDYFDDSSIRCVIQEEPLGLGHAILCASEIVGPEPFAVLLGDDIIRNEQDLPCIAQLVSAYQKTGKAQVAIMEVPQSEIHKYGAAEGSSDAVNPAQYRISNLVEKPKPGTEKTNMAIIGRYVLPAHTFEILRHLKPSDDQEIQLTEALKILLQQGDLLGYRFSGQRIDAGDRLGLIKANLLEALSRDELRSSVKAMLNEIVAKY